MDRKTIKEHYRSLYSNYSNSTQSGFEAYERNHVLKRIYSRGAGKKLLDLGAGDGTVAKWFQEIGYSVYGLEWTDAGVSALRSIGVNVQQHDIEDVPYNFSDDYFDEIFWGDNIEHLFFPEKVIREIHRILKPNNRLVLSTPNHGWIINRLYYLIMGMPRRTEGHRIPAWEWQHIRYFNKGEITKLLSLCDFGDFRVFGGEKRQPFSLLSHILPASMASVLVVEARKQAARSG